MLKHKFVILAGITLATAICCCGCDSYAKRKQAMVDKHESNTARNNVPVAQSLLENGEIDQAISILQECIADAPGLFDAHLLLGKAHFMQNHFEKADKTFAKALELDDRSAQGWYWLGETQSRQGSYKEALDSYDHAMQIDTAVSEYVIAAAQAHAAMDQYDKAIDILTNKKEAFAGDTSIVIAHAGMLTRSGRKEEAIKVYQNGLLFNADAVELQEGLGYLYMVEKRWEDAAGMFEKLLADADNGKNSKYLHILSICSMNTGEYSRSLGYLDKLNSEDRDDADFWFKTGQAALGAGRARKP